MRNIKILLIEDNPADQAMVEEVLNEATTFQPTLIFCERVQQASACVDDPPPPDIILLDLSLPDSSGLASLETVKGFASQVPIVIFTGLDDKEIGIEAINRGAEDYLVKGEIATGATLERVINFALERYKLRRELYQTMDDLKRSNQKLEDFAYVVSHDLKSPLSNLRSLIGLYDRDATSEGNRQLVDMMEKSIDKLNDMLAGFTDVFLAEESLKQPTEELNLEEHVNEVAGRLGQLMTDTNATLRTDFSEAPTIPFVPALLQSILQNLLSNAIKYRSRQRDPVIELRSRNTDDYTVLHVQDNGIGIDTIRNKERLFKLFRRFNVKHAEGSGVGLYMIKSLLESSGGRIEVESELDQGTLFKLYFAKQKESVAVQ